MKRKPKPVTLRVVGLGVVGLSALPSANATTQITFGGFSANNTNIVDIAGYGNNVSANNADYTVSPGALGITGTPDITLGWGAGYQTYTDWDGRGNVAQHDFNAAANISLTFTPQPGFGVLVNAFDMDAYSAAPDPNMNVTWSVSDITGTLASGTWIRSSGGRDTILTGLGVGNVTPGQPVTLSFTRNSGSASYIALDNLTFDQVPEPSTVSLGVLGLGLGALALRRRRK
jgi:MYXO-CTERM domain-containing protein